MAQGRQDDRRAGSGDVIGNADAGGTDAVGDDGFLDAVLERMVADKALPKYAFERRVDVFLATLLPGLLPTWFGATGVFVAPEMPIKKAANFQTTNVDHVYRLDDGRWLLVELKTDMGSLRDEQLPVIVAAAARGMPALVDDITRVRAASKHRRKYDALLRRLDGRRLDGPVEVVLVVPHPHPEVPPEVRQLALVDVLAVEQHPRFPQAWARFRHHLRRIV
jgi:hypothetical protein